MNKIIRFGFFLILLASVFTNIEAEMAFCEEEPSVEDLPALIAELHDKDAGVRCDAAEKTGKYGERAKEAVPDLIALLSDNKVREFRGAINELPVQNYACEALQKIGPAAVPSLLKEMKNPRAEVRELAAKALGKIKPATKETNAAIMEAINDGSEKVRRQAIDSMANLDPPLETITPVLQRVFRTDPDDWVRYTALQTYDTLHRERNDAQVILIEALKDKKPDIRSLAAQLLGNYGGKAKSAVPNLTEALDDNSCRYQAVSNDCCDLRPVCCDVADALGKIGPEAAAALPELNRILSEDIRGEVRASVAMTMLKIDPQNKRSIPCLIAALKNDLKGTGGPKAAAEAIRELGPQATKAIPALKRMLKHKDCYLRMSAARTLAAVAGKDAVPTLLVRMKREKELGVNKCARDNWESTNYHDHLSVRGAIIEALGEIGPAAESAVPELVAAVADPKEDYFSREAAVEALGKIDALAKSAVPALRRLLGDSSELVREAADEALKKIEAAK
jgi:HEAT repeat protein